MEEPYWGKVEITLKEMIEKRNISKTKLCYLSFLQHAQLNTYCGGKAQKVDLAVLARLCHALDCKISDLLIYAPPEPEKESSR